MADPQAPVVLELATLPRDQVGPFLLLGLTKDAGREQVEAHWAQRLIAARKGGMSVPLEDINWARESINDAERRTQAVATTLNADTDDGLLRQLAERYHVSGPAWALVDAEKPLADEAPLTGLPDAEEVRRAVVLPELPAELPAVAWLLDQFVAGPIDPWAVPLGTGPFAEEAPGS